MVTVLMKENVPSDLQELLKIIPGSRLEHLVRYSWFPLEEAVSDYNIREEDIFSLTAGPVAIHFESGLVIGASSNPGKNSVVLWVEKNELGEMVDNPLDKDHELFPFDAKEGSNMVFALGKRIAAVRVLHRKSSNVIMQELPSEVGLVFDIVSGEQIVLSHGLHNNSDDFSVITPDQISSDLVVELDEVSTYE